MVNVKKALYQGLRYQGFDPEEVMICFNIILKEEYYLQYCFFVDEFSWLMIFFASNFRLFPAIIF